MGDETTIKIYFSKREIRADKELTQKRIIMRFFNLSIIVFILLTTPLWGQESDKLGEDFDLEALPGILEKVNDFEELEKAINDSTNSINNLDLDNNGEVDYILIQEEADGETHIAFLRVAMAEDEFQDVATIEMEKQSSTTATFQIVGDSALYGDVYILEPEGGIVDISSTDTEPESEYDNGHGPSAPPYVVPFPAVRVTICVGVYSPGYTVFVSPYGFMLRPVWFRPWHPMGRSSFKAKSARHHRKGFKKTSRRRSSHASSMQKKNRKTSSKATSHKSSTKKSNAKSSSAKSNQKSTTQKKSNTQQKTNTQQKSNTQKKGTTTQKKNTSPQKRKR